MPLISSISKLLKSIFATLAHNLLAVIVVGLVGIPVLISWVTGTLNSLLQLLLSPMPLWVTIALALLILCSLIIPTLIVNRKNKSLQKELSSCKESLENQAATPKPEVKPEVKPEKETLTFTSNESPKIAPGIKVKTEFKQTGWYCVLKDAICTEHNRTLKPDNTWKPYEYACKAVGCKVKLQTPYILISKSEAKDLTEAYIRTNLNIEPRKTDRLR